MNKDTEVQQLGNTTPPEGNGTQDAGKTFTQDDVNKIVSERLARERAKAEPDPAELRERELTARESALTCKEYISAAGYPERLTEVFDTADPEKFKAQVELLDSILGLPSKTRMPPPTFVNPVGRGGSPRTDPIAAAFKRKD